MNAPDYYLGLDGGGSATRARLIDRNRKVLGEGRSGPSNLGFGPEVAARAIQEAINAAFAAAEIALSRLDRTAAAFGFASADIKGSGARCEAWRTRMCEGRR